MTQQNVDAGKPVTSQQKNPSLFENADNMFPWKTSVGALEGTAPSFYDIVKGSGHRGQRGSSKTKEL